MVQVIMVAHLFTPYTLEQSMRPAYASIDLETTGLEASRDAIIEIGVVLFDDEAVEEWSSLVNPRRRVPPEITDLTGITQAEVDGAPLLADIRHHIEQLTEGMTLVAHRVSFDLRFLGQNGLCAHNSYLDTHELATILHPTAGRFSLADLTDLLGIAPEPGMHRHRALTDAHLTARLFGRLLSEARALPYDTLEEIVKAGRSISWPTAAFFEKALLEASRQSLQGSSTGRRRNRQMLYQAPVRGGKALRSREPPAPIDVDRVASMLETGGQFAEHFAHFEHRPQQVEMARAVGQALNEGQHLMVEAGTGTGKSVAYLLPAIHWATHNDDPVVVSTNTINLQDQLIAKDIPDLQHILPDQFRATVLKGRSNYICPRLVAALRRNGPTDADEMRLLAKLLIWLPQTTTGERDEISLQTISEQMAWSRLSAQNEGCTADSCGFFAQACPLRAARQAAEMAHIIIVNHALLLSDIVTGNRVLPAYRYLIVDEAHHLEEATTHGLSFETDRRAMERMLAEITHNRGLAAELLGRCRAALPPEYLAAVEEQVLSLLEEAAGTNSPATTFFWDLGRFLREQTGADDRGYSARVQLTRGLRVQPSWDQVESSWDPVSVRLDALIDGLQRVGVEIEALTEAFNLPDGEEMTMRVKTLARGLAETKRIIDEMVFKPSNEMIYWAELSTDGEHVSLHAAPLHVGPLIQEHLFHQKANVILTSATLRTCSPSSDGRSGFDYVRERLHAWEADELAVGSPFDYHSTTLLLLPTDMPEPTQPGYQRLVESSLVSLSRALRGRTLVLFTSYSQLRQTATGIRGALADAGIGLLQQGAGTSRRQLIESFRAAPEGGRAAVLLGTRSFWEGVDVPGPALSCVVIVRLPFDVPSDPVFAARRQSFENPFYDYAVPEAVLRFRQGFGRLIRAKTDRGAVVCLDKRLLTKAYGRFFLEALPDCTTRRASLAELAPSAAEWLKNMAIEPA